jgi:chromosome segregation ATPase
MATEKGTLSQALKVWIKLKKELRQLEETRQNAIRSFMEGAAKDLASATREANIESQWKTRLDAALKPLSDRLTPLTAVQDEIHSHIEYLCDKFPDDVDCAFTQLQNEQKGQVEELEIDISELRESLGISSTPPKTPEDGEREQVAKLRGEIGECVKETQALKREIGEIKTKLTTRDLESLVDECALVKNLAGQAEEGIKEYESLPGEVSEHLKNCGNDVPEVMTNFLKEIVQRLAAARDAHVKHKVALNQQIENLWHVINALIIRRVGTPEEAKTSE